jgi:ubiquinone/menaquinone biosynthesis C-methylase UbiE
VIWESEDPIRLQGERRRAEVTVGILEPKGNDLILDVGCGVGYQISYVAEHSRQIVGLDVSIERLKFAKKKVKGVGLVCASSERLPFKPQIFDKVTCLELLEHLEDPGKTIVEIEVVLKRAGTLILSVPYKQRILVTQCIHCGKLTPLYGHIHSFDEYKLTSLLPENLKAVRFVYIGTVVSAYPLFSGLPTKLWKLIDDCSKVLPAVKPSWFISKIRKVGARNGF